MSTLFFQNRQGLTLIELLVVVAIISILSGIGLPMMMNAFDQSTDKRVITQMRNLAIGIGLYRIEYGIVPRTEIYKELALIIREAEGKSINVPEHDAWGHEFYYKAVDWDNYTLKSFGKDGVESQPASWDFFDPNADTVVINGTFEANHEGHFSILH